VFTFLAEDGWPAEAHMRSQIAQFGVRRFPGQGALDGMIVDALVLQPQVVILLRRWLVIFAGADRAETGRPPLG